MTAMRSSIAELTPAGVFLFGECEQVVATLAAMKVRVGEITGAFAGTVSVKSISQVVAGPLDAGIVAFKQRYPEIELILETGAWKDIVDALIEGDASVAVGFDEEGRRDLNHALLTRERMQLYCGPSHPLFGSTFEDPADLADQPFIAFSTGEPPAYRRFREAHGLGGKISGNVDNRSRPPRPSPTSADSFPCCRRPSCRRWTSTCSGGRTCRTGRPVCWSRRSSNRSEQKPDSRRL